MFPGGPLSGCRAKSLVKAEPWGHRVSPKYRTPQDDVRYKKRAFDYSGPEYRWHDQMTGRPL